MILRYLIFWGVGCSDEIDRSFDRLNGKPVRTFCEMNNKMENGMVFLCLEKRQMEGRLLPPTCCVQKSQ